ncbi:LPXTG cell wall anchor domain-containing protein [Streptomyces sp. NPDC000927]|uniref:LPXTG cell wall anchor domain-containing protein n=1 Tax=Streptomyces sp. NPDC000927 TaxID=3154371 RepID=UPI0033187BAF
MSKKNLTRAAAILGAAAAIAGPMTAASASASELPPYDCAIALPLLEQENPLLLAGIGCKDNTAKFVADHSESGAPQGGGNDSGVEIPDVPDIPDVPGLPGGGDHGKGDGEGKGDDGGHGNGNGHDNGNGGKGGDHDGRGGGTPTPKPDNTNGNGDQGSGDSDGTPGGNGNGDGGNTGSHGNDDKTNDTIDLAASEVDGAQLAQTGADDHAAPMLAAAGGLIAVGAGAMAFKRRQGAQG